MKSRNTAAVSSLFLSRPLLLLFFFFFSSVRAAEGIVSSSFPFLFFFLSCFLLRIRLLAPGGTLEIDRWRQRMATIKDKKREMGEVVPRND